MLNERYRKQKPGAQGLTNLLNRVQAEKTDTEVRYIRYINEVED